MPICHLLAQILALILDTHIQYLYGSTIPLMPLRVKAFISLHSFCWHQHMTFTSCDSRGYAYVSHDAYKQLQTLGCEFGMTIKLLLGKHSFHIRVLDWSLCSSASNPAPYKSIPLRRKIDGSSNWVPATCVGDVAELLASTWSSPSYWSHLGSKSVDGRYSFSLTLLLSNKILEHLQILPNSMGEGYFSS